VVATVTRNYLDLVRAPSLSEAALGRQFTFVHRERLESAIARGRGVIVVGPHLGNFSLVAQAAARQGTRVTVVVERLRPAALFDVFTSLRGSHGVRIVAAGPEGVRQMLATLRRGEVLALAGDRDVTGGGAPIPFFDAPAPLPLGPATLALRTGAALLPMFTYRVGPDRSVVVVQPPIEPVATGDRAADIAATTALVADALAAAIRVAPDQWAVLQRVWPD
jgi:phosphatidylinositol dimannoside acyltransferase